MFYFEGMCLVLRHLECWGLGVYGGGKVKEMVKKKRNAKHLLEGSKHLLDTLYKVSTCIG